jgi:hypothetical protein
VLLYGGRIDKITLNEFSDKVSEFADIRLKKYVDYRRGHYHAEFLNTERIAELEKLRHSHAEFKDLYPDECTRYVESLFVRYI